MAQTYTVNDEKTLIEAFKNAQAGDTITLTDNINLTDENWTPIEKFSGTFDGNYKTISGLKMTKDADGKYGFFKDLTDATVKDLTISEASITANANGETSILASYAYNSEITNCTVSGKINAQGQGNMHRETTALQLQD